MPAETGALLLGAGFSRRYGARDKRMEPLSNSSVARTTLRTYCQVFDHVAVVIREDDDLLAKHLADVQAELIRTDQAHLGMGHTLAAGARYAQQASWSFACIGLMDMPFVNAASLLELQEASTNLAPGLQAIRFLDPHSKQPGPTHPVLWRQTCFSKLTACTGDSGGRSVFQALQKQAQVLWLPTTDAGVMRDIDTPADLENPGAG